MRFQKEDDGQSHLIRSNFIKTTYDISLDSQFEKEDLARAAEPSFKKRFNARA